MSRILYTIPEAAEQVSVSVATIRRAIKATDPNAFPPPLRAKRVSGEKRAVYGVEHAALMAWVDSLKDA